METKIKYAKLHQPIFIPGVGNIKDTLVREASGVSMDLEMTLKDDILFVTLKKVTCMIPLTSVQHMVAE